MVIADFSGKYLNIDTVKEGDRVQIVGEGAYFDKDFEGKKSRQLDIPVRNGLKELIYSPKMDAGKKLVKAFGEDTADWVGREFVVHIVRSKSYGMVKEIIDIEPVLMTVQKM